MWQVRENFDIKKTASLLREPSKNYRKRGKVKEPLVSILISTYGQVDYTKRCLHSLEATIPKEIQSEILVIDDCSDDETPEFLKKLD